MTQYVYRFGGGMDADGAPSDKTEARNLLGGKGANLAEMANIGLPVPPGFTISTAMCTEYMNNAGAYPDSLTAEVARGVAHIQTVTGKTFGNAASVAGLRALRRPRLDARHDGHRAQPRPQ